MLQSDLFARVLLAVDGKAYICFKTGTIAICTAKKFFDLQSDPIDLLNGLMGKNINFSKKVNPNGFPIEKIPGLTLAYVDESFAYHCEYPILTRKCSRALGTPQANTPISFDTSIDFSAFDDAKHLYMFAFLRVFKAAATQPKFKQNATLPHDFHISAIEEIVHTLSTNCVLHEEPDANHEEENEICIETSETPEESFSAEIEEHSFASQDFEPLNIGPEEIPAGFVSKSEFAKLRNEKPGTVQGWIKSGRIKESDYIKSGCSGRYYIKLDAEIGPDGRTLRKDRSGESHRQKYCPNWDDKKKHERIQEDVMVSEAVRPYILNYEEANYYYKHRYREVEVCGRPVMIIDFNPDYFCPRLNKTNEEIIREGNIPVVPNDDNHYFNLHHIGQRKDSPFAIVADTDHNSEKYSKVFHCNPNPDKDLHGPEFDKTRRNTWLELLELYRHYGDFSKIPYNNHLPSDNKKTKKSV